MSTIDNDSGDASPLRPDGGEEERDHDEHAAEANHDHSDHGDHNDHHGPTGWRYWLYTTDHKVIGLIYLAHGLLFFALAGLLALLFRLELATGPGADLFEMWTFNSFITIHGLTMIFLVILPLSGAFANYLIPLQVGCSEMAYPRMNALGAWGISAGGLLVYLPYIFTAVGLGELTGLASTGGWFHFAPLSITEAGMGVDFAILGIAVFGITSTGSSINFMVTVLNERHEDMGWLDIPPFSWGMGVFTTALAIFSVPFLLAAWGMSFIERNFNAVFFDAAFGGAPLLYQWVFWIFGHPEVYVLVLPGMAIVAEIVGRFSQRPIYGWRAVLGSWLAISIFSVLVWMHHSYNTGLGASRYPFMVFSMAIAISFGVYLFAMIATMYKGRIHLTTPMLLSIAVIVGLVYSGMEGIMLGNIPLNMELHNTYFVVGHFHFTVFMVGLVGLFAGIYYWWPLMTGRMYHSLAAKFHAITIVFGLPALFMTFGFLGERGMIRRYATYTYDPTLHDLHILATVIAFFVAAGQIVFLANLVWSLRYGERTDNPWQDLLEGQNMGSPEWNGLPYKVPTPHKFHPEVETGERQIGGVATDGGLIGAILPDDSRHSGQDQDSSPESRGDDV